MVRRVLLSVTLLGSILFGWAIDTLFAYDSNNVHPYINEEAVRTSLRFDAFLKSIGYSKGVVDSIGIHSSKKIFEYFRAGGSKEDEPLNRTFNHFHNPLRPWTAAGLGGTRAPSISWVLHQNILGVKDRSWAKARATFYEGLTLSRRDFREMRLAYSFQALGQVMHLLSDVSVPAHVRNDPHVMPDFLGGYTYENWAKARWSEAVSRVFSTARRLIHRYSIRLLEMRLLSLP